ncbi:abortive infection family protein [Bradyrhizobium diversitatis]|uniref:Abortive infection family protein n=1 Tax=Bradyrhizobium diversitatis TaxID=2755406 RepID=A0ABS0PC37_9BRAD|nr:abortive infection family protein [Bradyrhizobium diversitatis]MBH5390862.1 abortive infection family protein [Bradyrhizobium diversitatis]
MINELRNLLASAIADVKAYDVPALCRRLNLGDGEEQEAFASKYKYAQRRLADVSADQVVASARQLLSEQEHFKLVEQLTKIDELNGSPVTTLTRRRLITLFDHLPLAREIEDMDFIRGLWPIASLRAPHPSTEATFEDYLHRHTVRNDDLSNRDVLEALGVLTCSRAQLFKLLAALTSPEVRSAPEQVELAEKIDALLRHDGYTLSQAGRISGSPFYAVRPFPTGSPADESISATLAAFDPTQVHARWTMALERRASEPAGAITLARTLLEDVCKWILDQAGETWHEADDLPVLYRKLAKVLKLAPDDHTEQVFKQILGSCQSVVESLGALRNKLSDAHSPGPKRARPQARHAELAVNLAGAMATFLVATWEARQTVQAVPRSTSPTLIEPKQ